MTTSTAKFVHGEVSKAPLRAEWQPVLFGQPNRARLACCVADWALRMIRIRVHRNHAIEAVAAATEPYGAWNGLAFAWSIGPYDDSLSFELEGEADIEVVWLDTERLGGLAEGDVAPWLASRLRALRARTLNPVVILAWPLAATDRSALESALPSGVHLPDLDVLAKALGTQWHDARTESLSGTRLANRACLHIARELACCWLPACVLAPIKCVALDLDETLYAGVLGEDGEAGVGLTDGHRALQEYLLHLRHSGVLLALVSRNDIADVQALFALRSDFPMRLADFSAIEVSWGDKAAALVRIAQRLRIGLDAIVFADDNPGELASVAMAVPVVTVQARANANETRTALSYVAGLFRWRTSAEDSLRADDLYASAEREDLRTAEVSPEDYLRSLQVRLQYRVGDRDTLARAAELVRKTNQFNLSLRRMNEAEIAARMDQHPANVVTIRLTDRLADSGIVGVLVGSCHGDTLRVEELAISCRALGRRLEDDMLTQALLLMARGRSVARISLDVSEGARNAPARDWLASYAGGEVRGGESNVSMPFATLAAKPVTDAIAVAVTFPETVR